MDNINPETFKVSPTKVDTPDLDWSQVRETIFLLGVAIAQIESSLTEGDESVEALTDSFTTLAGYSNAMMLASADLPDIPEVKNLKSILTQNSQQTTEKVHAAIVAFQFYDKLCQRLHHVSQSLISLANLINEPNKLYNPYEWKGLQESIKSAYSMEAERQMFDAVKTGSTIKEALDIYRKALEAQKHNQQDVDDDDIELF